MKRYLTRIALLVLLLFIGIGGGLMIASAEAQTDSQPPWKGSPCPGYRFGQARAFEAGSNVNFSGAAFPFCRARRLAAVASDTVCPGCGLGYGDGSRPRPRDGTGFGARVHQKQGVRCFRQGQMNGGGRHWRGRCRQIDGCPCYPNRDPAAPDKGAQKPAPTTFPRPQLEIGGSSAK